MTQKHFTAIAAIFKRQLERAASNPYRESGRIQQAAIHATVLDMARYLATTNADFKRDKFLSACGL